MSIVQRLQPVNGKVLVQPLSPEEKSEGGILLPDQSKKERPVGRIVSLSPEALDECYEVGDIVWYSQYAGQDIEVSRDENYVLIDYKDILAIESPEEYSPAPRSGESP